MFTLYLTIPVSDIISGEDKEINILSIKICVVTNRSTVKTEENVCSTGYFKFVFSNLS